MVLMLIMQALKGGQYSGDILAVTSAGGLLVSGSFPDE
jgi:hypothetical protein